VAGDYTFLHLGNRQTDLFGLYRVNADMSQLTHADFMMYTGLCPGSADGACTQTPTVAYSTGGGAGTGIESPMGNACSAGVRSFKLGSQTIRASQSQSGVFVLDLPSGQGGLVAFRTSEAAGLSDLANKSFGGISFPDNGPPQLLSATTGAVSGNSVPITSITYKGGGGPNITGPLFRPVTDPTSTAALPRLPFYTQVPNPGTYANSPLQATYSTPSTIPGLFAIDGTYGDTGRLVLAAALYKGKVLGFGSVYNWRQIPNAYLNSGAFILFEK
jgi:hypothetical protein